MCQLINCASPNQWNYKSQDLCVLNNQQDRLWQKQLPAGKLCPKGWSFALMFIVMLSGLILFVFFWSFFFCEGNWIVAPGSAAESRGALGLRVRCLGGCSVFWAPVPPACVTNWCSTKRRMRVVWHCLLWSQHCVWMWRCYWWHRLCRCWFLVCTWGAWTAGGPWGAQVPAVRFWV